jgi:hypothetical protein
MSALRRLSLASLQNLKTRAAGPKGGFWGEGHNTPGGNLFSESPPPAGQKRHWESWEAPWCVAAAAASLLLLSSPPRRFRRLQPRSPPLNHRFRCRRYFTFGAAIAILSLGLSARPDSSLTSWADRQAAARAAEQA